MLDAKDLFIGLDCSTQSLKAVLIDGRLRALAEESVVFDRDLPEFGTAGGVHRDPDGATVTSPALMWVAALDRLLEGMQRQQWPLAGVAALSGSGQQHGSVWLGVGARGALAGLDAAQPLRVQLDRIFTVADSPIWMDSSTTRQCREREAALGGPQAVAELTGSRAYERFTGNQIAKIWQTAPRVYEATDRIALVSSFMASLLAGDYVPIDVSDASGMNLMDLRRRTWAQAALDCTAPGLARRLGAPVLSHTVFGPLHRYYVERFGFSRGCRLGVFSGDNPNSLAGLMLLRPGDLAVSLGTSDTLFGSLTHPTPSATEGHVFAGPVDPLGYMALICWKNGSLTRESVRDAVAGGSWKVFDERLRATPPANGGRIGFYFREPEITPPVAEAGVFRFDASGRRVAAFPPEAEARAVIESQFLSMRLHGAKVGLKPQRILATGGASANASLLGILADIFGVEVRVGDRPGSAALGAAYRAAHALACERAERFVPFEQVLADAPRPERTVAPDAAKRAAYADALERYTALERKVCGL